MERLAPKARRDAYGSRINRDHSPILVFFVPWASILLASAIPLFFLTSAIPLLPPLGLLFLLAWRLVRPGLMPAWAGFPLGLWNDLFSGQPFGFSILFFSIGLLLIEFAEARFPRFGFLQDWVTAGTIIMVFLVVGVLFSGGDITMVTLAAVGPQIAISILAFPVVARVVASLDRVRLLRIRTIR